MKIVLSPDSFKGSLSSIEVSEIMRRAFLNAEGNVETVLKPMADGGEGTLETLAKGTNHQKIHFPCIGPLGEERESWYLQLNQKLVVIEGANIAGLPLISEEKRNPDHTTTFGIGQAIQHALDKGHRDFIVAIGGSSTNDGGMGMLQALGMKAFTKVGEEVGIFGKDVLDIERVDFSSIDSRLLESTIRIASDVDNPLTGPRGASHIYGPQKGATEEQVLTYDQALERYGLLLEEECGKQLRTTPGAGAAGGLGFAFLSIGAKLESGAKLVAEAIQLEDEIKQADLIITGEGQSDEQTLFGKAPGYVAELARKHKKPVVLLSGSLDGDVEKLNELFTSCFSIVPGPRSLKDCMDHAEEFLYHASQQIARFTLRKIH
ncbi:glycerate kinase [Halobacillus mangrovi]|uniref:glycerate kinase n=1 Tax=Halobacillus mangrovi TaxID=402384 RepID=UPI003D998180